VCARILKHFGSIDKVKHASVKELCQVPYLKEKVAEEIYKSFRSKKRNQEGHEEKEDTRYIIKKS
jgi:ERCC4-type nuclease